MAPPEAQPTSWTLRIVQPGGGGPASGVPVTLLDDSGDPVAHWVSDAAGLVDIQPAAGPRVRLRLGLRSEAPMEIESARFASGPVELEAPRTFTALQTRSTGPNTAAVLDLPGHVLQLARLVVIAPPAPAPGRALLVTGARATEIGSGEPVDFFQLKDNYPAPLRYGALIEVEQYWQPIGYATGDLLYSAGLAPGETLRLAVVDGRWGGVDGRGNPSHDRPLQYLARMIGAPLLGDALLTDETGWPVEPLTILPEADGTLTPALHQAAAETIRYLNERVLRASHAVRRAPLRVVEAGEGGAAPRTLSNPRTDRPVQYNLYEPLQRFRVSSRAARLRPAVLVPFLLPNLAVRPMVRQFGHLLRRALLDRTLLPELDALLGLGPREGAEWERSGLTPAVSELRVIADPVATDPPADLRQVFCFLRVGDARYTVHFFPARSAGAQRPPEVGESHWIGAVRLADFHQRPLRYPGHLALENGSRATFVFKTLHLEGRVGQGWRRLLSLGDLVFPAQSMVQLASLSALEGAAGMEASESRLLAHIGANLPYYSAAIIAAGDPAVRYLALTRVRDAEQRVLADMIENVVAGVVGNYIAFPLRTTEHAPAAFQEAFTQLAARPPRVPDDVTVTIPLPGIWLSAQAGQAFDALSADPAAPAPADRAQRGGWRVGRP
jgi:hypothetical protein